MKIFLLFIIAHFLMNLPVFSQEPGDVEEQEQKEDEEEEEVFSLTEERKRTLMYGIDSEILPVLEAIKEEKDPEFTEETEQLFQDSLNPKVKTACVEYFEALGKEAGIEHALEIAADYQNRNNDLVVTVLDYLSSLGNEEVMEIMKEIVREETGGKVLRAAIQGLSRTDAAGAAELLMEKYESGKIGTELKAEILLAFGRLQSEKTMPLLTKIAADDLEEPVLRRYACTALGEIGDPAAMDVLLEAYASDDPVFRNYALHAIGMIDAPETPSILMQALRDDYYKIRITASEALGERKVKEAVPILMYKAEKDPEISVRTAAAEAIGRIGTAAGVEKLLEFAEDERTNLKVRLTAIETLIEYHLDASKDVLKGLIKKEWDKPNSVILERICRMLSFTEADGLEDLFELMLEHPAVTVRIHGLRGIKRNRIAGLKEKVQTMAEEGNIPSVRKHALSALEVLQ